MFFFDKAEALETVPTVATCGLGNCGFKATFLGGGGGGVLFFFAYSTDAHPGLKLSIGLKIQNTIF